MIKRLLEKSELLRHVLILLQGTVIAQLVGIGMQLVLRRIFTVADFGIMSLYASAVGILAVLATGRYEMAIVLPKEDKNARSIFRLSIGLSFAFNILLLIVLLFTAESIVELIIAKELIDVNDVSNVGLIKYLIYCVPLGVFLLSIYNALNYLFTRNKAYKTLSNNRIIEAVSSNGANGLFGALNFGFFGLFFGYMIGFVTSILFLSASKLKLIKGEVGDTKQNLKKYSDFPSKSLPSGLLNILALQLPTFLIFGFFGAVVSGIYDIITRVLNAPITMIGRSVSQVFYQKISSDLNEGNPIGGYIRKSSIRLFLFMLIPMTVVFFFGEPLFAFVFGEDYRPAGRLAAYFAPFFLVRFVYYSQSTLFSAVRKIGVEFRQNLLFLIAQVSALLIGNYYFKDFETTFMLLAGSGFLCYAFFILALINTANKADQ
jgi:O-antigen/teichoic acid export membrane protein